MQQRHQTEPQDRYFTASEVAEFEYCPLVWWHQQFEPLAQADTEDLFARLVELELEHDAQAPSLPEYQMIEQLLVRRGAFEDGQQAEQEQWNEAEEIEEERSLIATSTAGNMRRLAFTALGLFAASLLLIVMAIFLH